MERIATAEFSSQVDTEPTRHMLPPLDGLPAGAALFDAAGRLQSGNARFHALMAEVAHDAASLRWPDLLQAAGEASRGGGFSGVPERPQSRHLRFPGGRHIRVDLEPQDDGSTLTLWIDLTDELSRLDELDAFARDTRIGDKARAEFLANMSHELRTPLNAIIGFSAVIRDAMLGPIGTHQYQNYAENIHDSAVHLLSLISDVLDISKVDLGVQQLIEEEVEIDRVVDAAMRLIGHHANEGGVTLIAELPTSLPPMKADRRAMMQVLVNLLSNAVKFTPSGGRVVVRAACTPEDGLTLAVADTGIGMPSADIGKALLPFVQLGSAPEKRHQGTGLGLPLAQSLIQQHGGELRIESAEGMGTTVTVWLPPARLFGVDVASTLTA